MNYSNDYFDFSYNRTVMFRVGRDRRASVVIRASETISRRNALKCGMADSLLATNGPRAATDVDLDTAHRYC